MRILKISKNNNVETKLVIFLITINSIIMSLPIFLDLAYDKKMMLL
jgi:hypothetical protein